MAYKSYLPQFSRIDDSLSSLGMEIHSDSIKEMLITKKAKNIAEAIDKLLAPPKEERKEPKQDAKKEQRNPLADQLRKKIHQLERSYDILKVYSQKLEDRLKTLEKQKAQLQDEQLRKSQEARISMLKEKEIQARDVLIKQLQFETAKHKTSSKLFEAKLSKDDEEKEIRSEGCVPIVPIDNFETDDIERAEREMGINGKTVWFKAVKPSKQVARALIARTPKIVICNGMDEKIAEMLRNANITVMEGVEPHMRNFHAFLKEEEFSDALKRSERKSFVGWLTGYRNR